MLSTISARNKAPHPGQLQDRNYQELAEYYDTAIIPVRVRKLQDKSTAEPSVRLVGIWIIAALRDRKFFSLRERNEIVAEKLEELNNRKFKQHTGTRRSAYLEKEQAYATAPFEAALSGPSPRC